MRTKTNKLNQTLSLYLAILLALFCLSLAGCGGLALKEEEYEQTGRMIPYISRLDEEKNQALASWFGPAAVCLEKIETESGSCYQLTYQLEKEQDETYRLKSSIEKGKTAVLSLPDIQIEKDGTLQFPDKVWSEAWQDDSFMKAALLLSGQGIEVDFTAYGKTGSNEQGLRFLVALYEKYAGQQIDTTGMDARVESETMRKAIALGLQDHSWGEGAPAVYELDNATFSNLVDVWLAKMNGEIYGIASQQATANDALELMTLKGETYQIGNGKWEDVPVQQEKVTLKPAPIDFKSTAGNVFRADHPLNRKDLAKLFVTAYEAANGPIAIDKSAINFNDTTDKDCEKAESISLLMSYPSSNTYSPELPVSMAQLPDWVGRFTTIYMNQWYPEQIKNMDTDVLLRPLSYQQIVQASAKLSEAYEKKTKEELSVKEKINDRSYDWYYAQNDTGAYSDVNCMPSSTAMVLKWKNEKFKKTVEQLRNSFPDITDGWTIAPVEQTLEKENVPYDTREVTMKNMLEDLDAGKVLFCQCNEYDVGQSGHCFVIYGYKQKGDSTWFLLNDPASTGKDAFGKEREKGKWMEGTYCVWIVDRFSLFYLAIAQ
ncbi:MAG: C39 family peptidase [Christensenellales bacterium]